MADEPLEQRPPESPAQAQPPLPPAQRTMHAAKMLGIVGLTLLLAALLNAGALVRDTKRMPFGDDRDRWLGLWGPFAAVSGTLRLDEPRAALDRALGRDDGSGADPAFILAPGPTSTPQAQPTQPRQPSPRAVAPAATAAPPTPTPEVTLRIPSQGDPLRLWVGGDSLAGIFGESLVRLASDTGMIEATLNYRISTGLARPDYYDWPGELRRILDEQDPDVMVLVFGSNDTQGLINPAGDVFQPRSDGWRAEYRRRVAATMDLVSRPGRLVMWVGLPPMRDGDLTARLSDIDQIFREEAASRESRGISYVDAADILTEDGTYTAYLDDGAGHVQLVRESDGVHLTRAGGDRLAGAVLYGIASVVPLSPSVRAR